MELTNSDVLLPVENLTASKNEGVPRQHWYRLCLSRFS